ncbi:MAG: Gfo/Idh/MocA family oxidoreductase [Gemmatimonadetes bacterium]|jgi:predicted dehydrogenase|nr:Gfo/Idh/MocA family oxidoreductase [Gemmatimonadota bacterium]
MAADKIRIGAIGIGQIGKSHLNRYADIEGAEIVAAADVDEAELGRVAEKFGIPDTYTDFRELLKRDDIQAVDVCLHNNLHAPVTIAALEAGKNVYCEKPIAGAYVDGKAMVEAAANCGRKLSIQLGTLFSKETKVAKRLIEAGRLGHVYHARSCGYRRRGRPFVDGYGTSNFVQKEIASGGALFDMGIYHIAQMLYLLRQPEVERVTGKIYQETGMDPGRRESSGYNVEELGMGFVRFVGDVSLDIIESWAIHLDSFEGSSIVGSEGGIRLDPFSYHATFEDVEMNSTFDLNGTDTRWHRLNENEDAYDSAQHHWIAALQGKVALLPTAELALQTMLISEGIFLSDELGREVSVEEVEERSVSKALKI